jgi:uncharacterized protein YpuA (DUF1002 family)
MSKTTDKLAKTRNHLKEFASSSNRKGLMYEILSHLQQMKHDKNEGSGTISIEQIESAIDTYDRALERLQNIIKENFASLDDSDGINYDKEHKEELMNKLDIKEEHFDRNLCGEHVSKLISDVFNSNLDERHKANILKVVAYNLNETCNDIMDEVEFDEVIKHMVSAKQASVQTLMQKELPENEQTLLTEMD